jgi:hypothetical protein
VCAADNGRGGAVRGLPAGTVVPAYNGQRNFPGLWWSATMGRHVGFESWLERDHAMLLDFDPRVVAFELATRIPAVRLSGAVEVRPVGTYW